MPTIFIVEEDSAERDSLAALVQSLGYKTKAYSDARSFLAAGEHSGPGCLLLSWSLPHNRSTDRLRALIGDGSVPPAVAMIRSEGPRTRARALKAGAQFVLAKPFDERALLDAIETAVKAVATVPSRDRRYGSV